jgi:RHS repeat-associated protein
VDTDPANVAVNSSPTTFYVYDGVNVRMEFTKADGIAGGAAAALSVRYFNGQGVDNVIAQENYSPNAVPGQLGSTYWLIKDQVGSTTDVLNANGQQVNHIDYTTFGQFQILDPSTGTYTLSANPPAGTVTTHLFTGREFDQETGDYYYRARNYNSAIGRFQSEDPLGMAAGMNQYEYAQDEPNQFGDPLGMKYIYRLYVSRPPSTISVDEVRQSILIPGDAGHTSGVLMDTQSGESSGLTGLWPNGLKNDTITAGYDVAKEFELTKEQYEGIKSDLEKLRNDINSGKIKWDVDKGFQCASMQVNILRKNGVNLTPSSRIPRLQVRTGLFKGVHEQTRGFYGTFSQGLPSQVTSATLADYLDSSDSPGVSINPIPTVNKYRDVIYNPTNDYKAP